VPQGRSNPCFYDRPVNSVYGINGYVGMIFDGEIDLSSALGDLSKFPCDEYYMLADDF